MCLLYFIHRIVLFSLLSSTYITMWVDEWGYNGFTVPAMYSTILQTFFIGLHVFVIFVILAQYLFHYFLFDRFAFILFVLGFIISLCMLMFYLFSFFWGKVLLHCLLPCRTFIPTGMWRPLYVSLSIIFSNNMFCFKNILGGSISRFSLNSCQLIIYYVWITVVLIKNWEVITTKVDSWTFAR